ncbi:MAG: S-layer protein, partial [Candidatus Micrarchaeia archaeon]
IAKVTANVSVSKNANYTISGISNIKATPSVTTATEPVLLKNLTTSPLVVLDSQANPNSNLILIGSGYVNSLSKTLQAQENITLTPTSAPIMQAYGTDRILIAGYYANQTMAAANNFIEQLYALASS